MSADQQAQAIAILEGLADDLISWGYPLEGQILRSKAHTVHGTYAADIAAADVVRVVIDPGRSRLGFMLKTGDRRHIVTVRMFRPADGER